MPGNLVTCMDSADRTTEGMLCPLIMLVNVRTIFFLLGMPGLTPSLWRGSGRGIPFFFLIAYMLYKLLFLTFVQTPTG